MRMVSLLALMALSGAPALAQDAGKPMVRVELKPESVTVQGLPNWSTL